jgi:integrase/recombinase XerD
MQYMDRAELRRLFAVAAEHNPTYRLALAVALWHGLRVSELTSLRGSDVTADGHLIAKRLKGSLLTVQPIRRDTDPVFDESGLIALAQERGSQRLFPVSRQYLDKLMKQYCAMAGIHRSKAHWHSLKHSIAMMIWSAKPDLGQLRNYLGHKSPSSSLVYLAEADSQKAFATVAGITI